MSAQPIATFPPRVVSEAEKARAAELAVTYLQSPEALSSEVVCLKCLDFSFDRKQFAGADTLIALANGDDTALLAAAKRIQTELRARVQAIADDIADGEFNP